MLLAREFVEYLSTQLVHKLTPQYFEASNAQSAIEQINGVFLDELSAEDQLNEEVREILDQYDEYMRQNGVSYQDMFRKIKNTLLQQRKIVKASGRDTGDGMKLSRDKINDISHKVVSVLRKSRAVRMRKADNEVRLQIVAMVTELLSIEDKVDKAARTKVRSQKREIGEGTEEYDLLHRRYYAEELKKLGIDLAR